MNANTNQVETAQQAEVIYKSTTRPIAVGGATQYDSDGVLFYVKPQRADVPKGWRYGILYTHAAPLVQLLRTQQNARYVFNLLGRHDNTRKGAVSGEPIALDDTTVLLPIYVSPYVKDRHVVNHVDTIRHLTLALCAPNVKLHRYYNQFALIGSAGEAAASCDGHVWHIDHCGYTALSYTANHIEAIGGIPVIKREHHLDIDHEYYSAKAARAYRGA